MEKYQDQLPGTLEGFRVIDWTRGLAGALGTMALADLGAEVIMLETPGSGAERVPGAIREADQELAGGISACFESLNRGKMSITANLEDPMGFEVARRLVGTADVFVEDRGFSTAARLGLRYEDLKLINPRLIYASLTSLGLNGHESSDSVLGRSGEARSGIMWTFPGSEPMNTLIADQVAGVMLSYGILVGLVAREMHGITQQVSVSQLGSAMWLQLPRINMNLLTEQEELGIFDRSSNPNPLFNYYRCSDGRWLYLSMVEQERYWEPLCQVLGVPELLEDPRFRDYGLRGEHSSELIKEFDLIFATRPIEYWENCLREQGDFIFERVQTHQELTEDPQVSANGYIVDFKHPILGMIKTVRLPVQLSETPTVIKTGAPGLGQDTITLLTSLLGYTQDEVDMLRSTSVVSSP